MGKIFFDKDKSSCGFTIVEVLVSVALLGVIIMVVTGTLSFLNRPVLLHRSQIVVNANKQFEKLINGSLKVDAIKPLYKSLEYETSVDSVYGLVTYQLEVIEISSGETIYELKTYRVYQE